VDEIFAYMMEKPDKKYEIVVGCDSASEEEPHFPAAIVVRRIGAGGRFGGQSFFKAMFQREIPGNVFPRQIIQHRAAAVEMKLNIFSELNL